MKVIAAFDFDKTLTTRESLLFFLIHRFGYLKLFFSLFPLLPYFIGYASGCLSRQKMKEAVLTCFFRGIPIRTLNEWGFEYAGGLLNGILRVEMMDKLRWHQQQGHTCVLISASPDFYIEPWGERNHFNKVLCSKLEVSSEGVITGRLKGGNCWGEEKVNRLLECFGPKKGFYLYAYGDSRGDNELLALADTPFLVV
jgi:phosphatidylglycerophosphatase C